MDKAYTPQEHDNKWQKFWEGGAFAVPEVSQSLHPAPTGKKFVIMMPPPNVTGMLHQGHALFLALEDTLIRWHRMLGDETLYLPGSDHASIAVQMMVVNHLRENKIDHRTLGREKFLEKCWEWVEQYRPRIFSQMKACGVSCDWSRVKFTMDSELNFAVNEAFIRLYKKGLVYRAERLVSWSPAGQTGLSDLEVVYEERESFLWSIKYSVVGMNGHYLVVATTRPETLLGDSAVAVNPNDERYKQYIGKKVRVPLVGREVEVIGDDYVDASFGTGVLKITPAHDFNDFELGQKYGLEKINIFTKEAKVVAGLPGAAAALAGLDRFKARTEVLKILEQEGLLIKTEKHKNRVGLSERWKDVVEPYLSQQWYVKMEGMGAKALLAVQSGRLKIVPHEFHNQFLRWMEGIKDWCVSRQLWWGQQIPAFHCDKCQHIEVAHQAPKECPKCRGQEFTQDQDVFDTWFSSGLWPFSTMGWPNENAEDFRKYYPGSVLETGFDILFFWVARMVMLGEELTGHLPFSEVYLHPMVRDEHGQKMSKTKGNVIDPMDIVRELGADTLRLTLNALCVQGRDLRLSRERLEFYRNFINKIWNATKFVLMDDTKVENYDQRPQGGSLHDRWILTKLDAASRDVNKAWSEFRMQEAVETLYHFVWNDFCDWYLECAKTTRKESQPVLLYTLDKILKLFHPVCPHVTEELWHQLPGVSSDQSLSVQSFPVGEAFPDAESLAEFSFLQNTVTAIRNLRAENGVKPSKVIPLEGFVGPDKSAKVLVENSAMVSALAKVDMQRVGLDRNKELSQSGLSSVVVSAIEATKDCRIYVKTSDLVDIEEEKERLKKELLQLQKLVQSQNQKLSNESFVARAPVEVVDKEKIKLLELSQKLKSTELALAQIEGK